MPLCMPLPSKPVIPFEEYIEARLARDRGESTPATASEKGCSVEALTLRLERTVVDTPERRYEMEAEAIRAGAGALLARACAADAARVRAFMTRQSAAVRMAVAHLRRTGVSLTACVIATAVLCLACAHAETDRPRWTRDLDVAGSDCLTGVPYPERAWLAIYERASSGARRLPARLDAALGLSHAFRDALPGRVTFADALDAALRRMVMCGYTAVGVVPPNLRTLCEDRLHVVNLHRELRPPADYGWTTEVVTCARAHESCRAVLQKLLDTSVMDGLIPKVHAETDAACAALIMVRNAFPDADFDPASAFVMTELPLARLEEALRGLRRRVDAFHGDGARMKIVLE